MPAVQLITPFINAANTVLQTEASLKFQRGNLSLEKSAFTSDQVTILISLVGHIQGVVLYGMSTNTCLSLVSKVMGEDFDQLDHLVQSGIAELGNVITAQALTTLSQAGYKSNVSPPALIQGAGAQISTLEVSRIVVPLVSEIGRITLHLALQESPFTPQSTAL